MRWKEDNAKMNISILLFKGSYPQGCHLSLFFCVCEWSSIKCEYCFCNLRANLPKNCNKFYKSPLAPTVFLRRASQYLFVCIAGLCPSQPIGVMTSMTCSAYNFFYLGRLSLYAVNQHLCTFRNWRQPFLNQLKGKNDRRKYFMVNLHKRMVAGLAGIEGMTSWSQVGCL